MKRLLGMMVLTGVLICGAVGCSGGGNEPSKEAIDREEEAKKAQPRPDPRFRPPPGKRLGGPP